MLPPKRTVIFGDYDTAAKGWTLTGCQLSPAEPKTNYVDKPGGDGAWDLSTALTDGILKYNDRSLTVTLECSEDTRDHREAKISSMINQLDGMRVYIILPDSPNHYVNGRLHVVKEYNDLAHAAVTVTATCKPWKYASTEIVVTRTATTAKQVVTLINSGRLAVVPVLTVEGDAASVLLEYGTASLALSAGTHQWPDLLLSTGAHQLTYSGSGTVTITYREAVLA